MTQAQHQAPAAQTAEQGEFQKLLAQSATYRREPLVTEDKLLDFLSYPDIRSLIEQQFPGELTDQRRTEKARSLIAQARLAVAASPDRSSLVGCTVESFVQAIASCAYYDLSFHKATGQAYLVRYGKAVTLMIGYQGFITLILRTGVVASIQVESVYKGEEYHIRPGYPVEHEVRFDVDRSDSQIIGVYAEARNRAGPPTVAASSA